MIVFNSDFVLEPCLRSVLPYGKVYCAEGPVKYWQRRGYSTSTDLTNAILNKYEVETIHGVWEEKDKEARAALSLVPKDTDIIWFLDSDEIWKGEDIEKVLKLAEQYDSFSFQPVSFYGGFTRYMTGFEERGADGTGWYRVSRNGKFKTHRPPTLLAPDGKPWREHRHLSHEESAELGIRFFHYSYVFPTQITDKIGYYAQLSSTIPNYLERVYKPWVKGFPEEQEAIEAKFDGVHDWLPERRGACRTKEFTGQHPKEIQRVMPQLQERLETEITEL